MEDTEQRPTLSLGKVYLESPADLASSVESSTLTIARAGNRMIRSSKLEQNFQLLPLEVDLYQSIFPANRLAPCIAPPPLLAQIYRRQAQPTHRDTQWWRRRLR